MAVRKRRELERLTEEELLSIFVPKKNAKLLLREHRSLYDILMHAGENTTGPFEKLSGIREVINRIEAERKQSMKEINSSDAAAKYFEFLEDAEQEEMWALMLTTKNGVIADKLVTKGTVNASLAAPRELFNAAVRNMAAGVIVVHNHPSGDSMPSLEDEAVTKKFIESGKILEIPLLDHIIIAKHGPYSFRENRSGLWA